jgi:hypothetical protein
MVHTITVPIPSIEIRAALIMSANTARREGYPQVAARVQEYLNEVYKAEEQARQFTHDATQSGNRAHVQVSIHYDVVVYPKA